MEKINHDEICFCPMTGLLDTISKKWSLMIIAAVGNCGTMGFNEIKNTLCGISAKTLSSTLKELEDKGLVARNIHDTAPPTVKYCLTVSGWELRELLIPILEWVMKNGGHEEEGCPIHSKRREFCTASKSKE